MPESYVYIMSNKKNGTLYTGVTTDLVKRVYIHRNSLLEGFTKKYELNKLVYYEACENVHEAIKREKQLKKWRRQWKLNIIGEFNKDWADLYDEIVH